MHLGRTDAGVHAWAQVANFKTQNENFPIEKLAIAVNSKLKQSIRIQSAEDVNENFNSRFSAHSKTYRYIINNSKYGSAILREFEYNYPVKLNVEKMQQAIKYFEGEHDFKSFKASGTSSKSSVRTIYKAQIIYDEPRIKIELTGSGFLYNMVRIIVGTLIDVGLEKIEPEDIKRIIDAKDRKQAGRTVPAHGLYLVKVEY